MFDFSVTFFRVGVRTLQGPHHLSSTRYSNAIHDPIPSPIVHGTSLPKQTQ